MKPLSEALNRTAATWNEPATIPHKPQAGSTSSDGRSISIPSTQNNSSLPSQLTLKSILPAYIEREVEMANASPYNLGQAVEIYSRDKSSRNLLGAERVRLSSLLSCASPEQIKQELARLLLHFPQRNMDEATANALYSDYILDLKDYPAWMISEACTKYRRGEDNKFFPRVAQLIALMKNPWHEMLHKLKTIEKILHGVGEHTQREERRLAQEDWDKLKRACEGGVNA